MWNYYFTYLSQRLWRVSMQSFRSSVFKAVELSLHEAWSNSSMADCRSFQCFKWSWTALVVKIIPFGMSAFNSFSIVIICANEAPFPPEMNSEHAFGSFKDKTLAEDEFGSCAYFSGFGDFSVKSICWSLNWRAYLLVTLIIQVEIVIFQNTLKIWELSLGDNWKSFRPL